MEFQGPHGGEEPLLVHRREASLLIDEVQRTKSTSRRQHTIEKIGNPYVTAQYLAVLVCHQLDVGNFQAEYVCEKDDCGFRTRRGGRMKVRRALE